MRFVAIIGIVVVLIAAFLFPALNHQNGWIETNVWSADQNYDGVEARSFDF